MAEPVRIPIADARCPWCGSEIGEWQVGSSAAHKAHARHRVATVIGAVQSVVGLVLAAWWPTDPGAIAATALVVGGSLAMVVGGWPAVRRTLTEQP